MTRFRFTALLGVFIFGFTPLLLAELSLEETADRITIFHSGTPVLVYHKAEMPPPEGADPAYRRSGFIHPLHAPSGDVVTSIHAEDHIHHMGLWHAWVKTRHRNREIDFWNLRKGQGTVRFDSVLKTTVAEGRVSFTARQQQAILPHDGHAEEVVLEEMLEVIVHASAEARVIDYNITQTNVTDAALELPAYRYGGGIAYRAPSHWGEPNDSYMTSEGLDRTEGHATRGRWCAMYGSTESGMSTVVIMNHPNTHDAPQRMRIWPNEANHVFFNYVPAQEHAWEIAPSETVQLSYRVLVFDGRPSPETIEKFWEAYTR